MKTKNIQKLILLLLILTSCATYNTDRTYTKEYIKDGKCTLHDIVLIDEVQEIRYGLPRIPPKYNEYHEKYFPNYHPYILGGCLVSENFPKEEISKICPRCKEEYLKLKDEIEKTK